MTEQLTKREQIALQVLSGRMDLLFCTDDKQIEIVDSALNFADTFLDISKIKK